MLNDNNNNNNNNTCQPGQTTPPEALQISPPPEKKSSTQTFPAVTPSNHWHFETLGPLSSSTTVFLAELGHQL